MRTHIQNPWTRGPQVFVHLSVEEAQQATQGLSALGRALHALPLNQSDALLTLLRELEHVLATERPGGIKGVMP